MAEGRLHFGAVLVLFLATANALDLSALRRELKAEVEEVMGNDYNDDDKDDDLLEALNIGDDESPEYDVAEPPPSPSMELESEEEPGYEGEEVAPPPASRKVSPYLPEGVPDIPGLYMEGGVMKYKGEKVTSITGMDGKDKGEKVYADENEVEDMDEVVEKVPIESLSEVEKITPIKSLEEIKRLLPVKSIKEIANIDEVKEILPVPEDIARKFIAKHKLKHGIKHKYVSGESALPEAEVHADEYQAQAGKDKESSDEYVPDTRYDKPSLEGLEESLLIVQREVKVAIDLLDELKTSGPVYNGDDVIEGESALPQGGSAIEESTKSTRSQRK